MLADHFSYSYLVPCSNALVHPLSKGIKLRPKDESTTEDETSLKFIHPLDSNDEPHIKCIIGNNLNGNPSASRYLTSNQEKENELCDVEAITSGILPNTLRQEIHDGVFNFDEHLQGFRPWIDFRQRILGLYRTEEHFVLKTRFLKNPTSQFERIQNFRAKKRFNQENISVFQNLTQDDYVIKMRQLKVILTENWAKENRLDCIRLVYESCGLLASISSPKFYPIQFVYVTDILDLFGSLVYDRLLRMATDERIAAGLVPLPTHFTIHEVLEKTRLTARNWFGRISVIQDLIPRIYIEASIMRCMAFMDQGAISKNIMRLCELVKSINHPLSSSYVRCYLSRISIRIDPSDRGPHWKCLNDWMQTYSQQPTFLLSPALEFLIQCVSYRATTYDDLLPLWEYSRSVDKRHIILVPLLNSLPRPYLGEHAIDASRIVTGSEMVTGEEIIALGENLLKSEVSQLSRKKILKAVWKCLTRIPSHKLFVQCCDIWIEFVAKYFTINEISVVLESLLERILPGKKYELFYENLLSVLTKICMNVSELQSFMKMAAFKKLFAIFLHDSFASKKSAEIVITEFASNNAIGIIKDIEFSNQILSICKLFEESLNPAKSDEEFKFSAAPIRKALDKLDLTENPQIALEFLVECRAALPDNHYLVHYIVLRIMGLVMDVIRIVRFTHSRSVFLQACFANLIITIPSLSDLCLRTQISLQSAQLAQNSLTFIHVSAFIDFALESFERFFLSQEKPNYLQLLNLGTYFLANIANIPDQAFSFFFAQNHSSIAIVSRFVDIILDPSSPIQNSTEQALLLLRSLQTMFILSRRRETAINSQKLIQRATNRKKFNNLFATVLQSIIFYLNSEIANEDFCVEFLGVLTIFYPLEENEKIPEKLISAVRTAHSLCKDNSAPAYRIKMADTWIK